MSKKLEDLELSFVNPKGLVKTIAWGQDYMDWTLEKRLEYAEALAGTMNQTAELMQDERNRMVGEVELMQKKVENAEKFADISKTSLIKNITESNAKQQELAAIIEELKKEVKEKDQVIKVLTEEVEKLNNG